mmetsp:Transcript_16703/g.57578  ORF Transcript_16703/g.57578 Transcript_16703/m.57578 type:complete len:341 (+) Transcript_16703:2143-3165(+)
MSTQKSVFSFVMHCRVCAARFPASRAMDRATCGSSDGTSTSHRRWAAASSAPAADAEHRASTTAQTPCSRVGIFEQSVTSVDKNTRKLPSTGTGTGSPRSGTVASAAWAPRSTKDRPAATAYATSGGKAQPSSRLGSAAPWSSRRSLSVSRGSLSVGSPRPSMMSHVPVRTDSSKAAVKRRWRSRAATTPASGRRASSWGRLPRRDAVTRPALSIKRRATRSGSTKSGQRRPSIIAAALTPEPGASARSPARRHSSTDRWDRDNTKSAFSSCSASSDSLSVGGSRIANSSTKSAAPSPPSSSAACWLSSKASGYSTRASSKASNQCFQSVARRGRGSCAQ